MATPRNKYPDPRETFGFAPLLLSDYFNVPQGAASNPAFGPAARGLFAAEDAYRQEQQSLERDRAAQREGEKFLDKAAGMTDKEVRDWLVENPRALATPQGEQALKYFETRFDTKKLLPKSDQDLGVSFSETIDDPALRSSFQGYMTQGIPFAEARDRYYLEKNNQQQAIKLAEAGIAEDEISKLTDPNGRINPVAVARRVTEEKRRREQADDVSPTDRNIRMLEGAIRSRSGVLRESGVDIAVDPQIKSWMQELDNLYAQNLEARAPAKPEGPPLTPVPTTPPIGQTVQVPSVTPEQENQILQDAYDRGLTAEEFRKERENLTKEAKEAEAVNQAWWDAKTKVAEAMNEAIPDKRERILEARAILSDKTIDAGPRTKMGALQVPYWTKYSNKSRDRFGFKEPGNLRTGSQQVGDDEVLQAWARDYLEAEKMLQVARPGQQPAAAPPPPLNESPVQLEADDIVRKLGIQ